ncbi:MAG: fused MFS/spermidine synthase, partial [Planctomycetota bacterium JB042]
MPWFGSSILVWSNVIGVTLASVAVGNLLGGRLADRRPRASLLATLFAGAAVLSAAVPHLVPWLAVRYLPPGLGLDVSFALLGRASLLVALVALGPPLVLLGAATPFLVRGATRDGRVGRAAGLVSGTATLGSLVGTWLPVHVLVPTIGSAWTCAVAGGAVGAAGLVCWLGARPRTMRGATALGLAGIVVVGLGAAAERGVGRPVGEGTEVLAELETRYQYARVEREEGRTILRLNEGLDSFHSLTVDGELLTGAYFDRYGLFLPRGAPDGRVPAAWPRTAT